jgi:hypothetical protein
MHLRQEHLTTMTDGNTTNEPILGIELQGDDDQVVPLALYQPWTTRNITPRTTDRSIEQTHFRADTSHSNTVLRSPWHIASLKQAVDLARRLCFSDVGRAITGTALMEPDSRLASVALFPPPLRSLKPVSAAVQMILEEHRQSHPWEIILDTRQIKGLYGHVKHAYPREIMINFDVRAPQS